MRFICFFVGGWVGGSSVGFLVFIDWHWCCIVILEKVLG